MGQQYSKLCNHINPIKWSSRKFNAMYKGSKARRTPFTTLVLAADLLQANELDYPIVQYADDTILIMKASQRLLQTFTIQQD